MACSFPDHTPQMTCSAPWHAGMAHTLGFMLAAKAVLESSQRYGLCDLPPRREATNLNNSLRSDHSRSPLVDRRHRLHAGRPAVRLRQHCDQRRDWIFEPAVSPGRSRNGWAAGCALIGCIAGCAAAGTVADYLGKKKGLGLCALCFALSSVGMLFRRESPSVCFLAADWRSGHRRGVGDFSELHRGDCSYAGARPLCDSLSAWNRSRNSCRRLRQHAHSAHGR